MYSEKARSDIEFQKRLLDGLLCAIRDGNCSEIFDMVRANASTQEIAARLDSQSCDREHVNAVHHTNDACNILAWSHSLPGKIQTPTTLGADPAVMQDQTGLQSHVAAKDEQLRLPPFSELMASTSNYK